MHSAAVFPTGMISVLQSNHWGPCPGGSGGGGDCFVTLDGTPDVPCSLAGGESSVVCPNGDCSIFNQSFTGKNGQQYWIVPGVNGPTWLGNGNELDPSTPSECLEPADPCLGSLEGLNGFGLFGLPGPGGPGAGGPGSGTGTGPCNNFKYGPVAAMHIFDDHIAPGNEYNKSKYDVKNTNGFDTDAKKMAAVLALNDYVFAHSTPQMQHTMLICLYG